MESRMTRNSMRSQSTAARLSALRLNRALALAASLASFVLAVVALGRNWPFSQLLLAVGALYFACMWHRRVSHQLAQAEAFAARS